jgi:integrase
MANALPLSYIIAEHEVLTILEHLNKKAKRSVNAWQNLVIFRLATCAGLRCKEMVGLECRDFRLGSDFPEIRLRRETTKGERTGRSIPLAWSPGGLADLTDWLEFRAQWGDLRAPYLCQIRQDRFGQRLNEHGIYRRFKTLVGILGPTRARELSPHKGRHTYCTELADQVSPWTLQSVVGHSRPETTQIYVHAAEQLKRARPSLYGGK